MLSNFVIIVIALTSIARIASPV